MSDNYVSEDYSSDQNSSDAFSREEFQKHSQKLSKKVVIYIVSFSAAMVLSFIHLVNWDHHFFTIIPLKIGSATGTLSADSLRKLADICYERMKYSCVDSALSNISAKDLKVEDMIRLGDMRRKLNFHNEAVAAYSTALSAQNLSAELKSDLYFGLARSYDALQLTDKAIENFNLAIQAKPEKVLITVTESYIAMLNKIGRKDLVQDVVKEARSRSKSDSLFSNALKQEASAM